MKAIILVAGYATRLYPLTLNTPKALLPIHERPIIDYIVDEIQTIKEIDGIYVVSNHKFAAHFEQWAKAHSAAALLHVLDDGTTTEENRRGAVGDILYAIEAMDIQDEIMVIAGDNFFTYSLKEYYDYYRQKGSDCVCVKALEDKEELKRYGIALLDENHKVIEIEEKPQYPKSNMVVYATYIYEKDTIPLFAQYIREGNNPDAPGHFPEWLCRKKDIYAFPFEGECYDIGTPESYEEVCRYKPGK